MSVAHLPSPTITDCVSDADVATYRENGFVKIPGIISKEEAAFYRQAVMDCINERNKTRDPDEEIIIDQYVNIWRENDTLKQLTLHPNVAAAAKKLAGVALRLWHDHIISKPPHNGRATEFHQDQPYWPHANSTQPISCWIALCDVPQKRGCMSFIPGSHRITDIPAHYLGDDQSLYSLAPQLEYEPKVTLPLQAGDCTFHHGRCAHMANANNTDEHRTAHVVIFMDQSCTYNGNPHICTNDLDLEIGQALDDERMFPSV